MINAVLIVSLSKDAPIGIVPGDFVLAPWLGLLGFVGFVVLLYGWMLRRSAAATLLCLMYAGSSWIYSAKTKARSQTSDRAGFRHSEPFSDPTHGTAWRLVRIPRRFSMRTLRSRLLTS